MNKRIALEVLITEREGMIAENAERAYHGWVAAYTEKHFHDLAKEIANVQTDGDISADKIDEGKLYPTMIQGTSEVSVKLIDGPTISEMSPIKLEVKAWGEKHISPALYKGDIFSLRGPFANIATKRLREALYQTKTSWARVLGHRYGLQTWHNPQSVSKTASIMLVSEDQVQTDEYDAIEYLRQGRFSREDVVALLQMLHGILQHGEEGS